MQSDLVLVLMMTACVTNGAATTSTLSVQDRADAEAEASSSFFDTFMAFLGSSTLGAEHSGGTADAGGGEAAGARDAAGSASSISGRHIIGDLSDGAPPALDGSNGERVKRTGQIPAQLLSGVINHKLGYITKGSHHVHFHNYGGGTKCEKPHWSLWDFKKALLGKLLDAAKAIGGGVLALKGKLITAKGHLVAAKGRKLASKGEELTEFGKSLLAKALGHEQEVVHTAPSAPTAPLGALHAAVPAHYTAPQYLPPGSAVPSGHAGYGEAVSLLNEYGRAGFANSPQYHRLGQAPTGPSATGPAGTLPGNLQAGLLVLQPAPSAGRAAVTSSVSSSAASSPVSSYAMPNHSPTQASSPLVKADQPAHPLVFAPEYVNAMAAAQEIAEAAEVAAAEGNKVRRYALFSSPARRRSLDEAMATVVQGLHGSHLLLHPGLVRSAAASIAGV